MRSDHRNTGHTRLPTAQDQGRVSPSLAVTAQNPRPQRKKQCYSYFYLTLTKINTDCLFSLTLTSPPFKASHGDASFPLLFTSSSVFHCAFLTSLLFTCFFSFSMLSLFALQIPKPLYPRPSLANPSLLPPQSLNPFCISGISPTPPQSVLYLLPCS